MFTLLCLLVLYLPFQIALNPASGIDLASGRVFILLLFLAWVFWGLKNRSLKMANNLITYFLLSFLFFAGLSCFWADAPDRALRKLAVFLSIFPLYFIIVGLVDSREKLERVLKCIICPAVVLSLIGIGQFILQFFVGIEPIMRFWSEKIAFIFWGRSFGAEVISNPSWLANVGGATYLRAFSLFPDPHMFSFYLGLIIPIAIGIGITNYELRIKNGERKRKEEGGMRKKEEEKNKSHSELAKNHIDCRVGNTLLAMTKNNGILHWPFRMTIVIILIVAQILTFSRGGYVGFALFLLFAFCVFFKKIYLYIKERICHSRALPFQSLWRRRESGNPVFKIAGVLFCVLFLALIFTNNPAKQRFMSIFDIKDGSNIGRIAIWKQSLDISGDHLLTGVGLGNYSFYIEPRYGYRAPIYAHNTYLDILSEMGIFALLVWVGMFLSVIARRVLPTSCHCEEGTPDAAISILDCHAPPTGSARNDKLLFLAGPLVWFSGHAFFDTPIYSPRVLPFLIIILALASCLSYYRLD